MSVTPNMARPLIEDPGRAIGVLRYLHKLIAEHGFRDSGWQATKMGPGLDPYNELIDCMATVPARREAMFTLARVIGGKGSIDIVEWQGKRGRTEAEVLSWLEKAIAVSCE